MMTGRLLFIDDDMYSMALYVQALEMLGLSVDQAPTVTAALELAKENAYDVIIIDLMLPPRRSRPRPRRSGRLLDRRQVDSAPS